jgi:hypothetical protein
MDWFLISLVGNTGVISLNTHRNGRKEHEEMTLLFLPFVLFVRFVVQSIRCQAEGGQGGGSDDVAPFLDEVAGLG